MCQHPNASSVNAIVVIFNKLINEDLRHANQTFTFFFLKIIFILFVTSKHLTQYATGVRHRYILQFHVDFCSRGCHKKQQQQKKQKKKNKKNKKKTKKTTKKKAHEKRRPLFILNNSSCDFADRSFCKSRARRACYKYDKWHLRKANIFWKLWLKYDDGT